MKRFTQKTLPLVFVLLLICSTNKGATIKLLVAHDISNNGTIHIGDEYLQLLISRNIIMGQGMSPASNHMAEIDCTNVELSWEIQNSDISTKEFQVNVSGLKPGLYFIRLQTEKGATRRKFTIRH